jgi:hypothetical protein
MAKPATHLAVIPSRRNGNAAGGSRPAVGGSRPKGLRVDLSADQKTFLLQGDLLSGALAHTTRRALIDRFFALPTLNRLHLNSRRGMARLYFDDKISREEGLEALAFVMRSRIIPQLPLALDHLLLDDALDAGIEIRRMGGELTFWHIEAHNARHYRLWHPLLRSEIVREQVLQEFATLPDVIRKAPSYFHRGAIHIWVRPHRIDPAHLIELLDPVLANYMAGPREIARRPFKEAMVNANLLLSPVSDFLFPPLGLVNALLVGSINRSHLVPAIRDLRQGRANLHLLYLSIGALTLLTFSFFAAAVMYWLLLFWPRKARQLRKEYEAGFLSRYRRRPARVWVEREGSLIETRVREVTPESVVVLNAGDIVPGDGIVLGGNARINDCLVTGAMESRVKREGEPVYASSQVLEGELRMQIRVVNEQTAAARIAAWYGENLKINPEHQSLRAKKHAEAAVLPVLLIGLLGLYRGGLSMAKAAIRPDYLTGPMIAEDFVDLAMTIRAAKEGILLANASSLAALANCDCLVLDNSIDWNLHGLDGNSFVEQAHAHGISEISFLSGDDSCPMGPSRFDLVRCRFSTEEKRAFIAQRQHFDHVVVYIGDCQMEAAVAAQADVAISVLVPPHFTPHGTQAAFLGADLIKILRLLDLVEKSRAEFNKAFGISLVPNAASVIGALYFNAHVETSVILSNLGTLANYLRYRSLLRLDFT